MCLENTGNPKLAELTKKKAFQTNGCSNFFHCKDEKETLYNFEKMVEELDDLDKRIVNDPTEQRFISISNYFSERMEFYHAAEIYKVGDIVVPESKKQYQFFSNSGLMYYEEGKYEIAV